MAEYSRLASGQVVSAGGDTIVQIPFIPDFIEISNATAAQAGAGVTRAWWETDMGQGAAFRTLFGTGDQYIDVINGTIGSTAGLTDGTGFKTISAGISLQYGPVYKHTAGTDFSISKANPALVTTTTPHNLVSGCVVIFQNLSQTATTGMQQIAGMPFVVTVTGPTTFTIPWDTTGANFTAFDTSTSLNNVGSFKQVLFPALYVPGIAFITAITLGATTIIDTTAPHNFVVGQEVAFRIPSVWGTSELNSLPNILIPGSPKYGYVVAVNSSTEVVVNIDSTAFTPFNPDQLFASFPGEFFPQIVAVGDVNSGGWPISVGSDLYPSPLVFEGCSLAPRRTINGPAIMGAYINATFMGFVIGSGVAGTEGDILFWRAYMHDKNYP